MHASSGLDVWRPVSEDSDAPVSGLLAIHRLRDRGHVNATTRRRDVPTPRPARRRCGEAREVAAAYPIVLSGQALGSDGMTRLEVIASG